MAEFHTILMFNYAFVGLTIGILVFCCDEELYALKHLSASMIISIFFWPVVIFFGALHLIKMAFTSKFWDIPIKKQKD